MKSGDGADRATSVSDGAGVRHGIGCGLGNEPAGAGDGEGGTGIEERQFQVSGVRYGRGQGWLPRTVAPTFGISVARVYVTKHRVTALLKKGLKRLQRMAGQALR